MAGNRKEPRAPKKIQVRVWGMDASDRSFQQTVTTVNLSRRGARLEGLECLKGPGEIIGIQCGKEKARFKVVWMGRRDSALRGQIGVESLEPEKIIWGVDLPLPRPDHYQAPQILSAEDPFAPAPQTSQTATEERRKSERYPCGGQAEVWRVGEKASFVGLIADISEGGCYIQVMSPLEEGARIEVAISTDGTTFRALGEVRTSHPTMGMGVAFIRMSDSDRRALRKLVRHLAGLPDLPEAAQPATPEPPVSPGEPEPWAAHQPTPARSLEPFEALAALETLLELLSRKGLVSREEFWAALEKASQASRH